MLSIDQILKAGEKIQEKRKQEAKQYSCWRFGYNDKGYTYVLLEELKDMARKEQFKRMGGWYDKFLGWHCSKRIEGYEMRKAKMEDIAEFKNGRWWTLKWKVDEFRKNKCVKILGKRDLKSNFIGMLGVNEGTIARVRLLSAKETAFRDRNFGLPGYHALPYKWEYRFVDDGGNIIVFETAYYQSELVKEWFGRGWADMVAKAIRHDDTNGVKLTRVAYPEFTKRGKGNLRSFARITMECPMKYAETQKSASN